MMKCGLYQSIESYYLLNKEIVYLFYCSGFVILILRRGFVPDEQAGEIQYTKLSGCRSERAHGRDELPE